LGRFYKIWADIVGMSDCEELVGLLTGENGDEMLISAFRSRKSISGPELVG